jgi:TIGR00730 family protein
MKISIFCSANDNIDKDFFKMTEELGAWIAKNGHSIVFGGCNCGLMEYIGKSVHNAGGMTIGVIPQIIEKGGKVSDSVDVNIACDNLSDRKELMLAKSDVVIALPGGIGTLDEIFTVAASHTIGYHKKTVILYNMKGFYDSLIALLNDMQDRGMIRGKWTDYILAAENISDIEGIMKSM